MKPFNIESMDNKNNNVKNYIEQGKELKSGQIASSHLIKTLEIYGFIPVKTGRIIYNEIIDIHPRIDTSLYIVIESYQIAKHYHTIKKFHITRKTLNAT